MIFLYLGVGVSEKRGDSLSAKGVIVQGEQMSSWRPWGHDLLGYCQGWGGV